MLKKIMTLSLAVFMLVAFNNIVTAQTPNAEISEAEINAIAQYAPVFEGQTPLTEAEIKKHVEILPEIINADNDEAKIQSLINANNFEPIRFVYISFKLPIVISVYNEPTKWEASLDKLPAVLKPSKDEITAAVKYMAEMEKISNQ